MSVDLTYYIEFRDKGNSEWKLLSYMMPIHKRRCYRDEDGEDSVILVEEEDLTILYTVGHL